MDAFNFITVRLGKDSINDINLICSSEVGIVSQSFNITVKCTQIPDNYAPNDYAFIWLGSDNNKGAPIKWKQGFKAVGKVTNIKRGANYNDTSETTLEIIYIFRESINRIDILRCAPNEYYWCSSFPLIGIDDHANQTIRLMSGAELSDIKAFFRALDKASDYFKEEIIKVKSGFEPYFDVYIPSPKDFPNTKNLSEVERRMETNKCNGERQQIFYGAPGTGKSHKIKDDVGVKAADEKNLVFRTTFHPDSDYSTFVGAYKPTTTKRAVRNVAGDIVRDTEKKEVYEDCITYSFIPQAFLQAYVAAWNNPDDQVFLVIEEINRGNCAQIFGDLFQLLDRDDEGASEYPIIADKDIAKYLNGNDEEGQPVLTNKDGIKDGKLRLPKNLYIWATMNTSDQSLFPIDSAFKRRWDWVYMPIADAKKNYIIEIDNDQYDWWSFLEAINAIIESTTHSEDKKLGYFFAKAKNGKISVETFVSKVIFYLWNDVFKDNETNHKAFKDSDGELLPFRKFFHHDGTVDTNMVIKFLQDLEVYPFETSDDGTATISDTTPNTKRQRDKSRYRVNGTDNLNKAQMTREAFRLYIEAHPDADAQTIAQAWNGLGLKDYVRHLVETEVEFNARTKDSTDSNKRATEFELSNGEKIYLSTQFGIGNIGKFIDAVNNAGWNIRIENQA